MKSCASCHQSLPLEYFTGDKRRKDGLDSYCKGCKAEKRKRIPREKQQEYQNRWRSDNRVVVAKRSRERYAANPQRGKPQREYYQRNREMIAIKRREQTLRQYGITSIEYETILSKQNGCCAICRANDPQHWSNRFQVDHNHTTGKMRGLLCAPCNGGLGLLRDDPARLRAAIDYLNSHEKIR